MREVSDSQGERADRAVGNDADWNADVHTHATVDRLNSLVEGQDISEGGVRKIVPPGVDANYFDAEKTA